MRKYHQDPDDVNVVPLGVGYRGEEGRLGYLLRLAFQALRGAIDQAARQHGLTAPQYATMNVLLKEPGLTGAQIARQSHLSPQTVNEIVVKLEASGLAKRKPHKRDKRILCGYLTPTGEQLFNQVDAEVRRIEDQVLEVMRPEDRESLARGLVLCMRMSGEGAEGA